MIDHDLMRLMTLMDADELRKDRKKSTKNDAVVRLASAVHKVGQTFLCCFHIQAACISLQLPALHAGVH